MCVSCLSLLALQAHVLSIGRVFALCTLSILCLHVSCITYVTFSLSTAETAFLVALYSAGSILRMMLWYLVLVTVTLKL